MNDLLSELHDLRTRLDATNQRLAAAEQELAHTGRAHRPRRRWRSARTRLGAAAALAVLFALVPLSLFAANPFNDLVPGSVHNADIDAIYNAGITTGCVPNVSYCPTANVTRQEMASFLARTAGIGGHPPVVNALTAVNANNANTVDGKNANEIVRSAYVERNSDVTITTDPNGVILESATITAPATGFLIVTAYETVQSTAITPLVHFGADVDLPSSSGWSSSFAVSGVIHTTDTGFYSGALTVRFPVAAGAHTVRLKAHNDGSGAVTGKGGALNVVFVPFDGAGAGSAGAATPATNSGSDPLRP
jgi:hypothetical protein